MAKNAHKKRDKNPLRHAHEDIAAVKRQPVTPQTESPAYRLAFADTEFLCREELRPVRLQLELLKPEMVLNEHGIESTIVIFGSARVHDNGGKTKTPALIHFYEEARKFARIVSEESAKTGYRENVVVSGGGPGIMEAANRGAADVNAPSIGLNIVLPHEQAPNEYITPELCLQFHYFALRKMHFLMRARAVATFPGGFGTMDEFFEVLTLIQTGKVERLPMVLFGEDFWRSVVNFDALVDAGTISPEDIDLISFVETAEAGWDVIKSFYGDE